MKTNYEEIADKYTYHHALGGDDQSGGLEQNKTEMLMFCEWMQEKKIKTILEIGLAQGYFSKFLEEIGIEVTGITVDEALLRYRPKTLHIGKSENIDATGEFDLVFDRFEEMIEAYEEEWESKHVA